MYEVSVGWSQKKLKQVNVESPSVGCPSCLQATCVSVWVQPSPSIVPHLLLKHISSRPSVPEVPPISLRSPSLQVAGVEI